MLRGFTIGITADRRWDEQASLFERRGATVVHAPTIRTLPLGCDEPLKAATAAVIALATRRPRRQHRARHPVVDRRRRVVGRRR